MMDAWGARSHMLRKISFEVSFMHLKVRKGRKEGYMEVRESKMGIGLLVKITCS